MIFVSKFKVFMRNIHRFHKNRLLASNTLSTMGLVGVGDLLAQYIEIKLTIKRKNESDAVKNDADEHSLAKRYDGARTGKEYHLSIYISIISTYIYIAHTP